MTPDPARAESQRKLDSAVDQFIVENDTEGGRITTAYMLVSHQQGYDDQGMEVSSYVIAYMNGSLPDHVALGLLSVASDTIRETGRWGREE